MYLLEPRFPLFPSYKGSKTEGKYMVRGAISKELHNKSLLVFNIKKAKPYRICELPQISWYDLYFFRSMLCKCSHACRSSGLFKFRRILVFWPPSNSPERRHLFAPVSLSVRLSQCPLSWSQTYIRSRGDQERRRYKNGAGKSRTRHRSVHFRHLRPCHGADETRQRWQNGGVYSCCFTLIHHGLR